MPAEPEPASPEIDLSESREVPALALALLAKGCSMTVAFIGPYKSAVTWMMRELRVSRETAQTMLDMAAEQGLSGAHLAGRDVSVTLAGSKFRVETGNITTRP